MEKYDFWFQVVVGTIIIILASFMTIGVSVPTVENGRITETGQPLWVSFVYQSFVFPGVMICMYAYWRARKRAANLGLFFLCWSAYFFVAFLGLRRMHELESPSAASFVVMILTTAAMGTALFVFDHKMVKRFGLQSPDVNTGPALTGPSTAWKITVRFGRLSLFFVCLILSRIVVGPRFVSQDWPRITAFVIILLLSLVIVGLISEDSVPKFLSFLNLIGKKD